MDSPPMFDISRLDIWKAMMSSYLKTLGLHVFLTAIKKCYLGNNNHIGANAPALEAIRSTLSKEYLMLVCNFDSAFAVWNKLITTSTSKLQLPIQLE